MLMTSLQIEILNPDARALLNELAKLKLIRIQEKDIRFIDLVKRIRTKNEDVMSLEDITKEVEAVRAARYNQ